MPAVHWRPEPSALTTPETYNARFMPNNILGLADLLFPALLYKGLMCRSVCAEKILHISGKVSKKNRIFLRFRYS